jgi:hypothetical protein
VKFAGQLKFPDIDHPGLPVVFLVEDNHASILLDGESLGRWALFDVEATRLVAKAFQVHLDGDEITFIADEPIDFAYKGVEHMAQTWAKVKALSLPRRSVVVRKARRNTEPSRIPELRAAVMENLEAPAPVPAVPRSSGPTVAERIAAAREAVERTPAPSPASTEGLVEMEIVEAPVKARLVPGPGLVRSLGAERPASEGPAEEQREEPMADMAEEQVEEPAEEPAAEVAEKPIEPVEEQVVEEQVVEEPLVEEPLVEEPLVEEPVVEEPVVEEPVEEPATEPAAEVMDTPLEEPVPVIEGWLDREEEAPQPEEVLTPWFAGAEDDAAPDTDDPIDWQYQPERLEPVEPAAASDEDAEDVEELSDDVKELIGTPAGSDEGLFVDLGRYEDTVHEDQGEEDQGDDDAPPDAGQPAPDLEPVLVGTTHERSGLFGAVRSAFVRNRAPHEHEFVDAPGGMGLTRQICADCGHISIRSDD